MAKIKTGDIQVEGLAELNRSLRALGGKELQGELKKAGLETAEVVASGARSIATGLGGVFAKSAPSIKAKGYTTGAGVSVGGAAYPFAGGAEFGSNRYKQFKPWRGNGSDAGYMVYESIRDNADKARDTYEDRLADLAKRLDLL